MSLNFHSWTICKVWMLIHDSTQLRFFCEYMAASDTTPEDWNATP